MRYFSILLILSLLFSNCAEEELFGEASRNDLWLIHEGAKLPIVVEGNTASKIFVILLHGGPGSSAQIFNAEAQTFTDALEQDYAMVYYDQRNAGLALGEWNEEKLTIEQHVEDLEKVMDLLLFNYGEEIQIFLAGHSWGGYLGTAFLLDEERQAKVKAWININGQINRNRNMADAMSRIDSIGQEQINENINANAWENLLAEVQVEKNKSINQYDVDSEDNVFRLIALATLQINRDNVIDFDSNSPFSSIFTDNYDPFRIRITNSEERDRTLKIQMYEFDLFIDSNLENIMLPSLSIYGYYDVTTPFDQGEYFIEKIGTQEEDKTIVLLNQSGHSSMINEPLDLASEMKIWIEKYR